MRIAPLVFAALLAGVAEPKVDIYLIGDSTMADKPTRETNPERGWGQLLPIFFDDQVVVHNHAVNGRSTKSFIDEGKWGAVLGQLKKGDYVFIEFGHNDEKIEDSTRYAEAHTAYRRNLERFTTESRAKGAIPVLFTPIVRRKFNDRGRLEETHGDYPAVVREVASASRVAFVDLGALTRALVEPAGADGSKRLYVWTAKGEYAMYPDGRQDDTHLSIAGATEVAKLAATAITRLALPLGAHVRVDSAPMPLWTGAVPGALGDTPDDRPTITPFLPPAGVTPKSAVVIFPGGGYEHLATEKEGNQVARWLSSIGVASFVVRYRLGPRYHHPIMMQDGQQAIRFVRANAARWHLDTARVGVMGFSAGGHLASTLGTHFGAGTRPDFMILAYPVITMDDRLAHKGSRLNLLGDNPPSTLVRALSNETQVTRATPPAFIVATTDDASVPVQNSQLFYDALRAAGVGAELHLFERGRHGFGLAPTDSALGAWTTLCENWLRRHDWATEREKVLTKVP